MTPRLIYRCVVRLETLTMADAARWDAWVKPRARTVTDLSAWWRVVRETYGVVPHIRFAVADGVIKGALSLFEIKHPLLGHYLTTAPYANEGGLYFDDDKARDALLADAKKLADDLNVSYLCVRTSGAELPGFVVERRYHTAVVDLSGGSEALWKRLPAKTRNQVRRGQKEGFTLTSGPQEVEPFWRVFQAHMKELGSPAHGLRYYRAIAEQLAEHARFIVVRDQQTVVAGALLFQINDTAANIHTVALREYNKRCPNYLLYWHMLESACTEGRTRFDMGRSVEGGGNLHFKENWGPAVAPLGYNYHLRTLREVPFADPRNPRYRLPIEVWRRLPLALTQRLGPKLIGGLA